MILNSFAFTSTQTIILIIVAVLIVVPHWKLWSRTGYHGAWSLLMLIPFVNIVSLWVLALIVWPLDKTNASR